MRIKSILIVVILVTLAFGVGRLSAGSVNSPAGPTEPGGQMYTLEQIYQRINDGTAATKQTTFQEPSSGPGTGTMHTLDQIYDLVGQRAPVPKTGQTTSYATGDDGDLEKGVAWPSPRFTVHDSGTPGDTSDDTVTDNLTGLMWTRNANHGQKRWQYIGTYPALEYCNGLTLGGYSDWRLPNVRELYSLVDASRSAGPVLPSGHPFENVQSDKYWSSSTPAAATASACYVNMNDGYGNIDAKTSAYYVWPVRGGQ
jgi:hypothetical protein